MRVSVAGARLVTVGGAGVTFTVALALPPFAEAVMMALPTACAATGIGTLVWPEAKLTVAGTVATAPFALVAGEVLQQIAQRRDDREGGLAD